jgi:mono/diheme cytochrome c family protein
LRSLNTLASLCQAFEALDRREIYMIRYTIAAALALMAASCGGIHTDPATPVESMADDGRDIAEAECAGCHAVGPYGDSPVVAAPTFRTVLSRYRADVLEEELIAGIRVAHPMPDFQFNPQGADALIAYLRSIQTPAPE